MASKFSQFTSFRKVSHKVIFLPSLLTLSIIYSALFAKMESSTVERQMGKPRKRHKLFFRTNLYSDSLRLWSERADLIGKMPQNGSSPGEDRFLHSSLVSLVLSPSLSIFFISVCQIGPVIASSVISHSHCFCHPRMLGSWLKVSSIDSPGLSAACEGTSL